MKFDAGRIVLVLDGHAPYTAPRDNASEESLDVFFRELTLTYLPLLECLQRLAASEVAYRLTMALSPTLLLMFSDSAFQIAYGGYLESRLRSDMPEPLREATEKASKLWFDDYQGRLAGGFAALQGSGHLEILASTATRACLPLLAPTPGAVRAQVHNGVGEYRRLLGVTPTGFWLPEAAYAPGLDDALVSEGLRYAFVDQRTLVRDERGPVLSTVCPSGLRLQGLDRSLAEQVSSLERGYPSLPPYFHSKRRSAPYDRNRARWVASEHGREFAETAQSAVVGFGHLPREPMVSCVLPARLLGTLWLEGIDWLEAVLRATAGPLAPVRGANLSDRVGRPVSEIPSYPEIGSHHPSGGFRRWIQPENDWIYPGLHHAAQSLRKTVRTDGAHGGIARRALRQAGRELLLAQTMDLAEAIADQQLTAATAIREHLGACHRLQQQVAAGNVDAPELFALEARHKILPALDPRSFLDASEQTASLAGNLRDLPNRQA